MASERAYSAEILGSCKSGFRHNRVLSHFANSALSFVTVKLLITIPHSSGQATPFRALRSLRPSSRLPSSRFSSHPQRPSSSSRFNARLATHSEGGSFGDGMANKNIDYFWSFILRIIISYIFFFFFVKSSNPTRRRNTPYTAILWASDNTCVIIPHRMIAGRSEVTDLQHAVPFDAKIVKHYELVLT